MLTYALECRLPRVRLRMPQHCRAMANDRLIAESEMLEAEKLEKQGEQQELQPSGIYATHTTILAFSSTLVPLI
jgi:hypothetical protein